MTPSSPHPEAVWQPELLIVGLHSSGKSTLARALARDLQYHSVELGNVVREVARTTHATSLVLLAAEIMAEDPIFIAKRASEHAHRTSPPHIFVGPRTIEEFEYLRQLPRRTVSVGINASTEVREKRWRRRHLRYNDTWDDREDRERQWGTASLLNYCDIIVQSTDKEGPNVRSVIEYVESSQR